MSKTVLASVVPGLVCEESPPVFARFLAKVAVKSDIDVTAFDVLIQLVHFRLKIALQALPNTPGSPPNQLAHLRPNQPIGLFISYNKHP